MATIIEDYVSFETAKLLKEKGFDEECSRWYVANEPQEGVVEKGFGENQFYINSPTLQMAMRWLRDMHNLCIEPYRTACGYLYTISTIPYGSCKCNPKYGGDDEDSGQWATYEGACEAAIKYCLEKLI